MLCLLPVGVATIRGHTCFFYALPGPMLHPFGGERRIRSVGTVTANDHQPLTVSGPRGLGCLLSGQQRVAVFDLEEDEELQSSSSDESEAHEDAMSN